MTVNEVRKRVEAIEDTLREEGDGGAHHAEDKLHREVLASIAFGALSIQEAQALATEALTTQVLSFSRWYE